MEEWRLVERLLQLSRQVLTVAFMRNSGGKWKWADWGNILGYTSMEFGNKLNVVERRGCGKGERGVWHEHQVYDISKRASWGTIY